MHNDTMNLIDGPFESYPPNAHCMETMIKLYYSG